MQPMDDIAAFPAAASSFVVQIPSPELLSRPELANRGLEGHRYAAVRGAQTGNLIREESAVIMGETSSFCDSSI